MKNHRLIAIILLLCMLASLTACMPSNLNQTEPENPTTTVPTTTIPPTTTVPGPKTLHLKDYVTGIDTSKINDDTIITLLRQAEAILQEYEVVIIEDNFEIKLFVKQTRFDVNAVTLDTKGTLSTEPDCLVTIYTDKIPAEQHEGIRYMVMGALLLQEYHDCYFNLDRHFFDKPNSDHYYGHAYISPSFKDSGYDTDRELFDAARYGEYSVEETGAYFIELNRGDFTEGLALYPVWTPEFYALDQKGTRQYYSNLLAKAFPEE